jgi:hypothetical protein
VPEEDEPLDEDELLDDDEVLEEALPVVELDVPLELSVLPDKMISAIVTVPVPPELLLVLSADPEPPPGGAPPGGGPPAPPGPLAKALEKRFCSSLA